jgi:hypothetical protein
MAEKEEDNISKKREERGKKTKANQSSRWVPFFISVFKSFLTVVILAIIGACFINVSSTKDSELDKILPTNFLTYFPVPRNAIFAELEDQRGPQVQRGGGGQYNEVTCTAKKEGKRIVEPFANGFPYGLAKEIKYKTNPPKWYDKQLLQKFKNWFAYSICRTYISSRGLLKDYIKFFGPPMEGESNIFSNQTFIILIMAPLNALFVSLLVPFTGFLFNMWYSLSASFPWFLLGLLTGYMMLIAGGTAFMQFFQFLKTFLLLPLATNWPQIQSIMTCNIKTLIFLFGWLVCTGAFNYLDGMTSGVMAIVYVILMIKMVYDSSKKKKATA